MDSTADDTTDRAAGLVNAALARAKAGEPVIPIWWTDAEGTCSCGDGADCRSSGKHPLTKNGLDDATSDSEQVTEFWKRWPLANIAVRTDHRPRVDIDLTDVADELVADVPLRAEAEIVRTPSGGLHIAFDTENVQSSVLHLDDGRRLGELKASRAYVLVPPSRIGSRAYEMLSVPGAPGLSGDPTSWLVSILPAFGHALRTSPETREYTKLGGVLHEGDGRHNALKSYAGLLWVDGIDSDTFIEVLRAMNKGQCSPPLAEDELLAIAHHFLEKRTQRPFVTLRGEAPAVRTVDDWLNEEDEPLDIVLGDGADGAILPIDGKGLIAGGTGLGKTNLLLRLGRNLVEGTAFLGRFPVPTPRRVLYIPLEGSRRGLRKRLRKVWSDTLVPARQRMHIVPMQLNLGSEADLERLHELIAAVTAEVLILDPLRNAHSMDENSSQEMAQLAAVLDEIILRHGCALVAGHHDRKRPPFGKKDSGTDRIRGSTALSGWLSFCLSIEKDWRTPDTLNAEWTKVRDAEAALPELTLTFDRDALDFHAQERTPVSKVSDADVLTAVAEAGENGIRGKELFAQIRAATGASDRTVRARVRDLVDAGQLEDFYAEEDRKTRAKSYRLVEVEE